MLKVYKCVLCGHDVKCDDRAYDERYIDGAGQLCDKCFKDTYVKDK